jgi:zinc and cadmium transporter
MDPFFEFLIIYLTLFLGPLIGGVIGVYWGDRHSRNMPIIKGFVGAFLLSVVLVGILPHLYHENESSIAIFIIVGFFLESLLEFIFGGKGHSHGNNHSHDHHNHDHEHSNFPLGLFIALSLHSFLEGMSVIPSVLESRDAMIGFVFGISFHELLAAFSLAVLLRTSTVKLKWVILFLIAYALMSPVGSFIGNSLKDYDYLQHEVIPKLLAVAVGTILHVAMDVLSAPLHSKTRQIIKFIAIGLGIAAGFTLIH